MYGWRSGQREVGTREKAGGGVGLEFGRGGRLEASGGWQWGQWGRQLQCNPAEPNPSTASDIRVQRRPPLYCDGTAMVLRCTPTPTSLALAATRHTGTNAPCCHSPDKHTHIHTHTHLAPTVRPPVPGCGREVAKVLAHPRQFQLRRHARLVDLPLQAATHAGHLPQAHAVAVSERDT